MSVPIQFASLPGSQKLLESKGSTSQAASAGESFSAILQRVHQADEQPLSQEQKLALLGELTAPASDELAAELAMAAGEHSQLAEALQEWIPQQPETPEALAAALDGKPEAALPSGEQVAKVLHEETTIQASAAALTSERATTAAQGRAAQPTEALDLQANKTSSTAAAEQGRDSALLAAGDKEQLGDAARGIAPERSDAATKPSLLQSVSNEGASSIAASKSANTSAAAAAPAARATLSAPLASPQWQNEMSQQVSNLALRGNNQVSLNLNPADLGPLVVELKMGEQSAQLQFLSGHAAVRSAVEQAIPQLRDALAAQGISLDEVNVGEHGQRDSEPQFAGQHSSTREQAEPESGLGASVDNADGRSTNTTQLPGQLSVYA